MILNDHARLNTKINYQLFSTVYREQALVVVAV